LRNKKVITMKLKSGTSSLNGKSMFRKLFSSVRTLFDSAYTGGGFSNRAMQKWIPQLGAPDTEFDKGTQETLTARSRDAYRNEGIARAVVERLNENVLGSGLRLQANIDYEFLGIGEEEAGEIERRIERDFHAWAQSKTCDYSRKLNFYQLQRLVFVSKLISGDCFVYTPYRKDKHDRFGLKIQVIEGDRVRNPNDTIDTPNLVRGIKYDESGRPIAYYVLDVHPYDYINLTKRYKGRFVEAIGRETGRERMLHICDFERTGRPGQSRGVPILAPILVQLRQLSRLSEAELMASVINAYFTLLLRSETLAEYGSSTEQSAQEQELRQVTLGPGIVQYLPEGVVPEFADPKRPNVQFDPFFLAILKQIGAATGVPVEILSLHFTTSYWAARAAMIQFWKVVLSYRENMVEQFCNPIYRLWLDEYVAAGHLSVKGYSRPEVRAAYANASWSGPAKGSIDELKEIKAARERIEVGVSTIQKEAQEISGMHWRDIHKQRTVEHNMRKEADLLSVQKKGVSNALSERTRV